MTRQLQSDLLLSPPPNLPPFPSFLSFSLSLSFSVSPLFSPLFFLSVSRARSVSAVHGSVQQSRTTRRRKGRKTQPQALLRAKAKQRERGRERGRGRKEGRALFGEKFHIWCLRVPVLVTTPAATNSCRAPHLIAFPIAAKLVSAPMQGTQSVKGLRCRCRAQARRRRAAEHSYSRRRARAPLICRLLR